LGGASSTAGKHYLEAFRKALGELGWQTITLEVRWAEGRAERMPKLAAELIGLNLDVLVAGAYPAARAAKAATGTIPIVMFTADPVGQGLVASLARPRSTSAPPPSSTRS
jgi:putative ABC transport system substrate-binding protein